jgi:predicted phosphodiesterase
MRLAIISDIHSNMEALEAAFKDLQNENIDAIYCTGDLVGYAANPNEVIQILRQNKVKCVMGNHDYACLHEEMEYRMTKNARAAIAYTCQALRSRNFNFQKELPRYISENGVYLTHGLPPKSFELYVSLQSNHALINAFSGFQEQVAFVGHTHLFEIYELTENRKIEKHTFEDNSFELKPNSRYIISAGSVGQPRDDNREAGYLIFDTTTLQLVKRTVQFDVELTIEKIKTSGIPMANRLRLLKDGKVSSVL